MVLAQPKTWTPDRTADLERLWADGLAGGAIAKRLGVTRGMVAGKRHSLGLPPRSEAQQRAAMVANGRRTAALMGHVGRLVTPVSVACAANLAALETMRAPLAGSTPRPWEQRAWDECAFPVEGFGRETMSCCLPREEGSAYCFGHRAILRGSPWPPSEALTAPASLRGLPPVNPLDRKSDRSNSRPDAPPWSRTHGQQFVSRSDRSGLPAGGRRERQERLGWPGEVVAVCGAEFHEKG
jgi:hypothetical protein